jgi:hypothetical protein
LLLHRRQFCAFFITVKGIINAKAAVEADGGSFSMLVFSGRMAAVLELTDERFCTQRRRLHERHLPLHRHLTHGDVWPVALRIAHRV